MSLIVLNYVFASGNTIIASQHNSNNSTIYNDYNGNITDANIASAAAIQNSKLNLASISQNITTTGSLTTSGSLITNGSLTTAGNVVIGSPNQGDIFYDNGTTLTRLTHGTNGQFLQTQGASANPQWAPVTVPPVTSNVLFQYTAATVAAVWSNSASIAPLSPSTNYNFLASKGISTSFINVWHTKFSKTSGINTVTVYVESWCIQNSNNTASVSVSIGAQTGNASSTTNQNTPQWINFTIDVSGLTNGTVYDVVASIKSSEGNAASVCYMGNLIAFGS